MKMEAKVFGAEALILELRNKAQRVSDTARKTMHRGADKIVERAKLFTPRDDGELEDSIRQEKSYGEKGRLQIDVTFGGVVNGVDVDTYGMEVHENYEGMLKHGPGKNTLAKMAANPGVQIGSKFLTRAAKEQEPKLNKDMIAAVKQEVES